MDQAAGFLESELDRAVAALGFSASGDVSNVVAFDSLRAQATLRERERRFRELLDALPAAVYTTDAAGRITYYNDAAASLWGHRPTLGSREWCGSWKLFWPDGTPLSHDECPMAVALKGRPRSPRHGSRRRKAGWNARAVHPLPDPDS